MAAILKEEKARRRNVNASVIGTNAMEGLVLDTQTLALMRRFEEGELTREQLSTAIDLHVERLLADREESRDRLTPAIAGAA